MKYLALLLLLLPPSVSAMDIRGGGTSGPIGPTSINSLYSVDIGTTNQPGSIPSDVQPIPQAIFSVSTRTWAAGAPYDERMYWQTGGGTASRLKLESYGTSGQAILSLYGQGGTLASPAALTNGSTIGQIDIRTEDSNNALKTAGAISWLLDAAPVVNGAPTRMGVNLSTGGAAVEVMRIDSQARMFLGVSGSTVGVGGILYVDDFTHAATTTTTSNPAVYTYFSTATIPANTLARYGDTLVVTCYGNLTPLGGSAPTQKSIVILANQNGVVVSSRAVALGAGASVLNWTNQSTITRVASNSQMIGCLQNASGSCIGNNANPSTAQGLIALPDASPITLYCAAAEASGIQGAINYVGMTVEFKPGTR